MLNAIIHLSLKHRAVVIAAVTFFALVGAYSLRYLPIDAFPDTTPVQVQINTVAASLAPEQIERLITFPVEQAISGLAGLEQVRSLSRFGLSQVVVTFEDGTSIYLARQLVMERLATVELPAGIERPKMGPVTTGLGEVFYYLITSKGEKDLYALRDLHDWTVRPLMRTVPGTAEINSWGGNQVQYQVRLYPDRLIKHEVTFDQVRRAIEDNNVNVGGGNIDRAGGTLLVQGIGATSTVEQIGNIVVAARDGTPIRVRDLADVAIGHIIRRGAVTGDGQGEVVLGLGFMLMGENSNVVTWRMKSKLEEVRRTLPPGFELKPVYDRTELVTHVIDTVRKNLFEGGLLVIAVLFVFLGNLRAGLIVASAIPLSMLFAFGGMLRFGIAGSLLSLGAIDFGLVVDSSVVMVENCVRRLANEPEALAFGSTRTRIDIVRDAAIEVRKPTMFGELIIMIVYLPVLTLEGIEGKMFRPMALTVIFALVGSMVMSLTLMPVLASLLLPRNMDEREPLIVRLVRWLYAPSLRLAMRFPYHVLSGAAIIFMGSLIVLRGLGSEFVPRLSEGALVILTIHLPGTSLVEANRANTVMEKLLLASFPDEIEHIWSRTGSAEVATDPMGIEQTDMFISLRPRSSWTKAKTQAELVEQMQEVVKPLPGQKLSFTQPIEQRMSEMISGIRADIAVKIFGEDFNLLLEKAQKVEDELKKIDGAEDVAVEQVTPQPILQVRILQDQVARYGVPARAVLDLVEAVGGKPVGDVLIRERHYPLAICLPASLRASPETLGQLLLPTAAGERIPLARLAVLEIVEQPSMISREWSKRRIGVQCNVRGRDVGSFVAEARARLERAVPLPPHYRMEWGGQFENMEHANTRLKIVVPLALALILMLLYFTYNNIWDALRVFTGVPLACIGGVLALWIFEMPLSISAVVGFIALSGVSVLNNMVLVTFILHLRERGMSAEDSIRAAALTRLRPVLMTALVASFGFLPMALSTGMGAEVQRPLATVVIGGVISSTFLTLVVLPALYLVTGARTKANVEA